MQQPQQSKKYCSQWRYHLEGYHLVFIDKGTEKEKKKENRKKRRQKNICQEEKTEQEYLTGREEGIGIGREEGKVIWISREGKLINVRKRREKRNTLYEKKKVKKQEEKKKRNILQEKKKEKEN